MTVHDRTRLIGQLHLFDACLFANWRDAIRSKPDFLKSLELRIHTHSGPFLVLNSPLLITNNFSLPAQCIIY